MADQNHSQRGKRSRKGVQRKRPVQSKAPIPDANLPEVPDALQRTKDRQYPQMKRGDLLTLQRAVGNKALRLMMAQRHAMPPGREAVGDEEDEIQRRVDPAALQRHTMPAGREAVGDEEDVIQRSPGFGRSDFADRDGLRQTRRLWGSGRSGGVQRKNGKGGAKVKAPAGAGPKGGAAGAKAAPAPDPKVVQAKKEFSKFVAGGPYTFKNYVPDKADNFGKFDAVYDPANKSLSANMRVKFAFPDMPSTADPFIGPIMKMIQNNYITTFINHVTSGWSGKFNFKNVREPQSVWKKLNPVSVKVNVKAVKANQHYTFNKYFKQQLDKKGVGKVPNVESNATSQVHMYLFNTKKRGFTNSPAIGKGELARLNKNLPKIRFANSTTDVDAKYIPDLQFISDYLKRMNRPKFNIDIVGHANKTGNEPDNVKYSKIRAEKVLNKMKAFGVTNHKLTATGVGSAGATAHGSWRKVDYKTSVDKGFTNTQDVDLHEFGHMLGLDDEYDRGDARTHTTQKDFVRKMLGDKKYGKGQKNKYADEVTKIDKNSTAGVMYAGDEVRVYNYVTMWQALYDTAAKAATQPAPPFTWKDWKVIE